MVDDVSFKSVLNQSIEGGDPFLAAACHPHANLQDRQTLESILFATMKLKLHFASATYTPASVLHSQAGDSDRRIRLRVAKHPAATQATLSRLARSEIDDDLCARIAGHASTPQDMLEELYEKRPHSCEIRHALCCNPHTPQRLLKRLAVNAAVVELKGLARNADADSVLLRQSWEEEDVYLRAEVVAHPNCPPDLRDLAEQMPQVLVRRKLAQNPALPRAVLIRLLGDTEAQVRAAAVRHLTAPMMAALSSNSYDPSRQVRRDQARHTGLPLSWINRLAFDTDSWVRRLIARNQTTPEQTLRRLADDAVMEVRRGVARNPKCSNKLLLQLARDPHPWVRAGVALRDDITRPLIIELSRDNDIDVLSALGKNLATPHNILECITCHEDQDVRRAVILNGSAPRPVLSRLLEDPYPLNRALLTGHSNLENADLERFLHDPEPRVRFAGAAALAARLH